MEKDSSQSSSKSQIVLRFIHGPQRKHPFQFGISQIELYYNNVSHDLRGEFHCSRHSTKHPVDK